MRSIIHVRSGLAKLWSIVIPCAALLASAAGCTADDDDGPTTALSAALIPPQTTCTPTVDIVVSDDLAFGAKNGGVIGVDPLTGQRTMVSQNNSPTGPNFDTPRSLVFDANGMILVADSFTGSPTPNPGIVRVDRKTGLRTVLSNNSSPSTTVPFVEPTGIALESTGTIVVADISAFGGLEGGVFRVNAVTGARTLLSANGSPAGPQFENPWDVAVAPDGLIYVVDAGNTTSTGKVMSIDPVTGRRRLISENGAPAGGPRFVYPRGITVDATGSLLVSDRDAFGGDGGIIRVDPVTGKRTTLSSNTSPAGGPAFRDPGDLVVESCGAILITDTTAQAVYRVDSKTGQRSIVSANATPGGTPTFASSYGIAAKSGVILAPDAGTGGSPAVGQN
jgi:sugar lactone lactonase YvrE